MDEYKVIVKEIDFLTGKTINAKEVTYKSTELVKDVLRRVRDVNWLLFQTNNTQSLIYSVDYYMYEDVFYWDSNPNEVPFESFVERYSLLDRVVYVSEQKGGIGCTGDPLSAGKAVYDFIKDHWFEMQIVFFVCKGTRVALYSWINNMMVVRNESFYNSLDSRKKWTPKQLSKAIRIDNPIAQRIIMKRYGYFYSHKKKKYYKNK